MLGDQVFFLTSSVILLTLSDCILYLTIIRLNRDNHFLFTNPHHYAPMFYLIFCKEAKLAEHNWLETRKLA